MEANHNESQVIPDGLGMAYFTNGDRYEGEMTSGEFNGTGTLYYSDGSSYSGQWKEGVRQGFGRYVNQTTGEEYVGDWVANERCGKGSYFVNGQLQYEGDWVANERHGQGKALFYSSTPSSSPSSALIVANATPLPLSLIGLYVGAFSHGLMNGSGRFEWSNGDYIEAEWKNGLLSGSVIRMDGAGNELRQEEYDVNGKLMSWKLIQTKTSEQEEEETNVELQEEGLMNVESKPHESAVMDGVLMQMLHEVKELQLKLNSKLNAVQEYISQQQQQSQSPERFGLESAMESKLITL